MKTQQKGFTLIELLVVIAIIAILAGIAVSNFADKPGKARIQAAELDIKTITNALEFYKLDNLKYPTTSNGIAILITKYLKNMPKDPWGVEYKYISDGNTFNLYTYGADKLAGGDGENKDIKVTQ